MAWTIEYYTNPQGNSPVEGFLRTLPGKDEAKIAWTVKLLSEFGLELGMPYARPLKGKLWELRTRTSGGAYRIIYFAHVGQRFVLLHGFVKKTQKTPRKEMETAERRMVDYLSRHEGANRYVNP